MKQHLDKFNRRARARRHLLHRGLKPHLQQYAAHFRRRRYSKPSDDKRPELHFRELLSRDDELRHSCRI